MPRREDICLNCREPKEIVSHGLCAACNMREHRAESKRDPDQHRTPPKQRLDRKKCRTAYYKLLNLADDLNMSAEDIQTLRALIAPYTRQIRDTLLPGDDDDDKGDELTVNTDVGQLTVNSPIETSAEETQTASDPETSDAEELPITSSTEPRADAPSTSPEPETPDAEDPNGDSPLHPRKHPQSRRHRPDRRQPS